MKRFYLTQEQFNSGTVDGEEFNHIVNVIRLKKGDGFIAFFGDEKDYICEITDIKKGYLSFKVNGEEINPKNPKLEIHLFQALAKGEKMELVAQKTTEIGISKFIPFYSKNCDVKPNTTKVNRLEKIIISASKQCGRSRLVEIGEIETIKTLPAILSSYDLCLFANEREDDNRVYDCLNKHKTAQKIALIVGPEGGFTPEEIEIFKNLSVSVSFGKRILRTETASIYLTSLVSDFYRN